LQDFIFDIFNHIICKAVDNRLDLRHLQATTKQNNINITTFFEQPKHSMQCGGTTVPYSNSMTMHLVAPIGQAQQLLGMPHVNNEK
jgi:aspartyl aminopeptidase